CAARACLFRRTDLATGYRTRRVGGDDDRNPGLGLHAVAAELGGRRYRRSQPALPGPVGNGAAAPAGAHRTRSPTACPRRNLEPFAQRSCPCGVLAWTGAGLVVPSALPPTPPSFRLWRSSVTVEELTTTVSRYLGEERTRTSFDSYALTRGISIDPKAEADFQLLRYAEHLLASAIGAASS